MTKAAKSNYSRQGGSSFSLGLIALIGILGYFGINADGVLIAAFSVILLYEFERRLDLGIPLMQVAGLLAVLQWLVGPYWFYHGGLDAGEMGMAIGEREYFHFAIPGTASFVLGLLYFAQTHDQRRLIAKVDRQCFFQIGMMLNGAAIIGDLAGRLAPGQLAFAFFLLAQLRYVGILYILYSSNRWRLLVAALFLTPLLVSSAKSAMFHDLLLWVGIIVCYWFCLSKRKPSMKFAIVAAGCLGAFSIQAVKGGYRAKVWQGESASLTGEIVGFWENSSSLNWDEVLSNAMVRVNQGWIVSRVMYYVPASEPYANGDTLKDAAVAAFMPRILNENKAKAGGRTNFMRFTGLSINESTSMNISMLGEAYANFGIEGGVILMGFLGSAMALAFSATLRWSYKYPTFIFWMPMIFYQAIKAETDLTEVLNQVTKGGLVAVVLYAMLRHWYPDRTRRRGRVRDRNARGIAQVKSRKNVPRAIIEG